MYRNIQRKFMTQELMPNSRMSSLPNIGPYLYERLRRKFSPRAQNITIRQFSRNIRNMSTAQLKENLQRVMQNERANQCVGPRGQRYHVRDTNEMGFKTILALLRVLKNGADGYNLGANMLANPNNIQYPAFRSQAAKHTPCKSRSACRAPSVWRNGSCQYLDRSGFEGIGNYPGQQIHNRNVRSLQQQLNRANTLERTRRDVRRDPDTARDVRNGHGTMRYAYVNANTLQRKPGKIIRLPL